MTEKPHVLVGKTINQVFLADDQQAIKFVTDTGDVVARCDGDCCSMTWIEDLINAEALIGAPVTGVEDLELPDELRQSTKTEHYEEVVAYYGCAIKTSKGTCTIAYRNSSNGYYGGRLVWSGDDYYYGGVYGQNKSAEKWVEVAKRRKARR